MQESSTRDRRRSRQLLSRFVGFSLLPFIAILSPFLILPVLARSVTRPEWAALGIGQSVGAAASIAIIFGWSLTGPSRVARSELLERRLIYAESMATRIVLLVLVVPAACLVTLWLVPPDESWYGTSMTVAMSLGGLSVAWYAIGAGRPRDIALFELLPRLLTTVAALYLLVAFDWVITYPALISVGSITGFCLYSRRVLGAEGLSVLRSIDLRRVFRTQFSAATTESAGAAYSTSAVAVVGATATIGEVAAYSSGDRLYRMSLLSISALSNSFQGWVAEGHSSDLGYRARKALMAHFILGASGAIMISAIGPWVSMIMFGRDLAVDGVTADALALAFLAVSLNTTLGRHVLVPALRTRTVLVSTLAGALVGVPTIAVGAAMWGAGGGAAELALSQITVFVCQVPSSVPILFKRLSA